MNNTDKLLKIGMELGRIQTQYFLSYEETHKTYVEPKELLDILKGE